MKIIIIRSNPVAPDPRVEKEASALGKAGHEVTVLSWDRDNENLKNEKKIYYNVHRFKLKAPYGHPSLFFMLFLWWIYEIVYLVRNDFDVLHACDLDTLIVALPIAKLKNKFLVYDSFDFYSDCLPLKIPNVVRKMVATLEIFLAKFANFVILVDESRLVQFKNEIKNTIIIYNSPPDSMLPKWNHHILTDSVDSMKDFTIFYAGILDENRGFKQIISASEPIHRVKLIIAGYGTDKKSLINLFEHTRNLSYLGKLQYKEVIRLTIESDLLFALYDPVIPNHKYSSPNKLFEAMMCGKPIIVSDDTSMANIVRDAGCGIVVSFDDIKAIREGIIELITNPKLREKLGKNGRRAYENKYKWSIMENRLLDGYNSLLVNKSNVRQYD